MNRLKKGMGIKKGAVSSDVYFHIFWVSFTKMI